MGTRLKELRDELANDYLAQPEPFPYISTTLGHFKAGFDAACAEWEKIVEPLVLALEKIEDHDTDRTGRIYSCGLLAKQVLLNYRKARE